MLLLLRLHSTHVIASDLHDLIFCFVWLADLSISFAQKQYLRDAHFDLHAYHMTQLFSSGYCHVIKSVITPCVSINTFAGIRNVIDHARNHHVNFH